MTTQRVRQLSPAHDYAVAAVRCCFSYTEYSAYAKHVAVLSEDTYERIKRIVHADEGQEWLITTSNRGGRLDPKPPVPIHECDLTPAIVAADTLRKMSESLIKASKAARGLYDIVRLSAVDAQKFTNAIHSQMSVTSRSIINIDWDNVTLRRTRSKQPRTVRVISRRM